MSESTPSIVAMELGDRPEQELPDYRPVCGLAIVGLLVGVASVSVFLHPVLWCLAIVGALLNGLALRQIAAAGSPLSGRRLALIGLTLSCLFGASAASRYAARSIAFRSHARETTDVWFALLRDGQFYKAHQLTAPPSNRFPLDDHLPERYTGMVDRMFQEFYAAPLVRLLVSLGPRAEIHYCGAESVRFGKSESVVNQIYSLTVDEGGRRTSCFFTIEVARIRVPEKNRWAWKLNSPVILNGFPRGWHGPRQAADGQ